VKVRRAGFAYRMDFFRFIARFKVLGAGKLDARVLAHGSDYDIAAAILNASVGLVPALTNPGETQLGKTKIFIKSPETFFQLQEQRKAMVNREVVKIQAVWRRYLNRRDLVNLRLEMAELFNEAHKECTPADLLRPYSATYVTEQELKLLIAELLEVYQLSEDNPETLQYSDQVLKLGADKKWERIVIVITNKAVYFAQYIPGASSGVGGRGSRGGKKRSQRGGVRSKPRLLLRRRNLLRDVESVWLSLEADDFVMLAFRPQEKLKKPVKEDWVDKAKVQRCMETQEPFKFMGKKKHRCHFTGRIYIG
jgi:myosin-1